MEMDEKITFISYTSADRDRVEEIADHLAAQHIAVWMDHRRLKAGQRWDYEIRKALDRASIIVIFISNNSVGKNGYVQKELTQALEKLSEKIMEDIYLIPVLLDDDVEVPYQLKDLQFIRRSDDQFFAKLSDVISHQLQKIGIDIQQAQDSSEVSWSSTRLTERRDGTPGYEADLQIFRFNSEAFPAVSQIGDYLKGRLLDELFAVRKELIDQSADYNFGQARFSRTHTIDVASSGPRIKGRIISILFAAHSYYARAAHPNMHFTSFAFFIDPLFAIGSLKDVFEDADAAFTEIQKDVRRQLLEVKLGENNEDVLDEEWVSRGTENWDDFSVFVFGDKGIEFSFSPYSVAAYVFGAQFAEVDYALIEDHLKPIFKTALELGW